MSYDFKFLQELFRAAVVAAVVALGGELLTFNEAVLENPLTWGLAALAAVGAAALGAVWARISGSFALR